jgi:hypothetical protein
MDKSSLLTSRELLIGTLSLLAFAKLSEGMQSFRGNLEQLGTKH